MRRIIVSHVKPVSGQPLTFRTEGIGRPKDVTLKPFYQIHRQRYSVYWQLLTEAAWQVESARIAADEARRMAEEARVVDVVHPGEEQSETDHKMQGEQTQSGDSYGFKWRQVAGSLSYEVKVLPGQPLLLVASFRDGRRSAANFDLLVDGQTVASQPVANDASVGRNDCGISADTGAHAGETKRHREVCRPPGQIHSRADGLARLACQVKSNN